MQLDQFHFELPPDRIAQTPARPRDSSRLMRLPRSDGACTHGVFRDLPACLHRGDLLIVNRTQVMPARLAMRRPSGGRVEMLLSRPVDGPLDEATVWEGLGRPGSALQPGRTLVGPEGIHVEVVSRQASLVQVRANRPLWPVMQAHGQVPLPPYVSRSADRPRASDADDYQSMFAAEPGAVAAPTASLHFTPEVMRALAAAGVEVAPVLLHVGPGTFLPIRPEHAHDVRQHRMHAEAYYVPEATAARVRATQAAGGRVVAVGTTSLRALESWATTGEPRGESRLFVYPGHTFAVVDGLLTNFHLPGSTLLLLVSALAGRERILSAYDEAIAHGYRFYSYGDAMLIL